MRYVFLIILFLCTILLLSLSSRRIFYTKKSPEGSSTTNNTSFNEKYFYAVPASLNHDRFGAAAAFVEDKYLCVYEPGNAKIFVFDVLDSSCAITTFESTLFNHTHGDAQMFSWNGRLIVFSPESKYLCSCTVSSNGSIRNVVERERELTTIISLSQDCIYAETKDNHLVRLSAETLQEQFIYHQFAKPVAACWNAAVFEDDPTSLVLFTIGQVHDKTVPLASAPSSLTYSEDGIIFGSSMYSYSSSSVKEHQPNAAKYSVQKFADWQEGMGRVFVTK